MMFSAHVSSNEQWIAKCIVQGFFVAPIEALPEVCVTDIVSLFRHSFALLHSLHASISPINVVLTWASTPWP